MNNNNDTVQQLYDVLNNAQGTISDNIATTGFVQTWPNQWQQPFYATSYCTGEHVYSEDEKLLLNAIRRDEKLKDKTLKFVLAKLLKALEK